MLVWKRGDGINARTGLHRPGFVLSTAPVFVGSIDLSLYGALLLSRALGVLFEISR
jgi:hypothetical protein